MRLESQLSSPPAGKTTFNADLSFNVAAFAARHGGVTESTLRAGARLYAQGQSANCLYYIENGRVQLSVFSGQLYT